jgi:hypothetical protein
MRLGTDRIERQRQQGGNLCRRQHVWRWLGSERCKRADEPPRARERFQNGIAA